MAPAMSKQRSRPTPSKDIQFDALLIATQRVRPAIDALISVLQESAKGCRAAIAEVGDLLDAALQNCTEVLTSCCCCSAIQRLCSFPWIRAGGTPLVQALPIAFTLHIVVMLYNAFVFAYMPAAGIAFNSPTSMVFHALIFMLLSSFVSAVSTNPGHVPDDAKWRCYDCPPPELTESKRPPPQRVAPIAQKWQARWCQKTDRYKADRAHHCSATGHVVLRMDHYCPWIGNTVGFRNHKFFFLFLFYANAACGMLNVSLLELLTHATLPALTKFLLIGSTGLSALLSTLIGPFFLFHCFLLGKNMTTIEFVEPKESKDGSKRSTLFRQTAYDVGLYRNICSVMGENPLLWMVPVGGPSGDGLSFPRRTDIEFGPRRPLLDAKSAEDRQDDTAHVPNDEIAHDQDEEKPKEDSEEHNQIECGGAVRKAALGDEASTIDPSDCADMLEDLEMASSTDAHDSSEPLWTRAAVEFTELTDDFKVGCEFISLATRDGCQGLTEVARESMFEAAGALSDAMCRFTSICAGTNRRSSKVRVTASK